MKTTIKVQYGSVLYYHYLPVTIVTVTWFGWNSSFVLLFWGLAKMKMLQILRPKQTKKFSAFQKILQSLFQFFSVNIFKNYLHATVHTHSVEICQQIFPRFFRYDLFIARIHASSVNELLSRAHFSYWWLMLFDHDLTLHSICTTESLFVSFWNKTEYVDNCS